MIFRIYSLFQVVVPLVMIHDVMDILRHYYLYTFKLLDPMPKPSKIEAEKLIGTKVPAYKTNVTDKDALLYALGIGFSTNPLKADDFKFTNEFDKDFTVFPTMGVVVPLADLLSPLIQSQHVPEFNPFAILHAQHKLIMVKPRIEMDIEYEHNIELVDCMDKGKNAFALYRCNSYSIGKDGKKQLAFINESMMFIRGLGGFNYPGKGFIKPMPETPKRNPDYQLLGETYASQAFVYRLCTDMNPLHIVPSIAQAQNFQRPILHGLASYGTVGRAFVQQVFGNDDTKLKSIHCRFVGHVYPGQTLDIYVWKNGSTYVYEAEVRERKTKAIVGVIEGRQDAKL